MELATLDALNNLPAVAHTGEVKFESMAGGDYFKRIQLYSAASDLVKEGKFPMNHWGLVLSKESVKDLGEEVNLLPLSWRFAAVKTGDPILASYNPKSPLFQKIQALSQQENSGAFFGFEFLMWCPTEKMFATYFANSATARNSAPKLKAILEQKKAATFKSEQIKNTKHSWRGPVFVPCSLELEMPPVQELMEVATKFANPTESNVEVAPTSDSTRER